MKKKRRLKKSAKILLALIGIFLVGVILFLALNKSNNKKDTKDNKNEKTNEQVNIEPEPEKPSNRIRLAMVGDVLIHEAVYNDADLGNGNYDFSHMFTYIPDLIDGYDLKYFNQESIIGGKNLGISAYPSFNSPDEIGDTLVDLGFNMVSLANNHTADRGQAAIDYTLNYWKSKNIIMAGSYASSDEQNEVKVYEMNGIKFAYFSYTTITNTWASTDYALNMYSNERAKMDIENAKAAGAEVIIVAMHWGEEYTNEEIYSQQVIAEYLASLGVNVIIGSHPHVVEPIKYIGNTLVIYSLGNFISNQLVLGINPGTGLFVGVDIIKNDDGTITFENLNYELLLQYSDENDANFSVIPYSKLNDNILNNYEVYKNKYEAVVERYMEI